jgi:hypothetical protein
MASINLQGDTSGSISISAPSVAGSNTLTLPATTQTLATQNALGVRNLIINGDMRIHQRGGTVNQTTSNPYSLDRWRGYGAVNDTFSMQQSSDAPADFSNSLLVTVLSTQASGWYSLEQVIEGYNIEHLNWGTSDAKDVTFSFWVKSSVTGTYSGSFRTPSATYYSYAFEYTINSANTWEQKTVTISGPTVGTFGTGNSAGFNIFFGLSTGSITAGSWQAANDNGSSSGTQFVNNAGATFYITGVQLEVGDTATPFEHRPYDMELQRCQRYYYRDTGLYYIPRGDDVYGYFNYNFPTTMRASPTLTFTSTGNITTNALSANPQGITNYIVSNWTGSPSVTGIAANAEL